MTLEELVQQACVAGMILFVIMLVVSFVLSLLGLINGNEVKK